jgi:hypothetical protein
VKAEEKKQKTDERGEAEDQTEKAWSAEAIDAEDVAVPWRPGRQDDRNRH